MRKLDSGMEGRLHRPSRIAVKAFGEFAQAHPLATWGLGIGIASLPGLLHMLTQHAVPRPSTLEMTWETLSFVGDAIFTPALISADMLGVNKTSRRPLS